MNSINEKINGKKTYLVALAMALWAVLGLLLGKFGMVEAVNYLLTAGAMVGFRSAIDGI